MSTAQQAATVVALRELGYKVPVKALGALVYGILPGSPAAAAFQVGDVISKVNGLPVAILPRPRADGSKASHRVRACASW